MQHAMINLGSVHALGFALGLAISGSAFAAVTSPATLTVMGRAPTMGVPTILHGDLNTNGRVDTGDTLTAVDGLFDDLDVDAATASTYRWHDGSGDLGNASRYTLTAADLGKSITLYVKPHTDALITEPADGREVSSVPIVVVSGAALLSVAISGYVGGSPQVGTALTATPTCVATCGTVTYQWQIEDAVSSNNYMNIRGATGASYTPVRGDQKRKIQVVANR